MSGLRKKRGASRPSVPRSSAAARQRRSRTVRAGHPAFQLPKGKAQQLLAHPLSPKEARRSRTAAGIAAGQLRERFAVKAAQGNLILAKAVQDTPDDPAALLAALARVKSTSLARGRQMEAALKKARLSKRDRGLVIFSTAGKRYPNFAKVPDKVKVYAVKVDAAGRRTWLNGVDPNTKAPGVLPQLLPRDTRSFNWRKFARVAPKKYGETLASLVGKLPPGLYDGTVFRVAAPKGDLDDFWGKAPQVFALAAKSQADHSQWVFDVGFTVEGEKRAFMFTSEVLRSYQFYTLGPGRRLELRGRRSTGVLRTVVKAKLADPMWKLLARAGLVTSGSVRRVRRLSGNGARPRGKWKNAAGFAWSGAHRREVIVRNITFTIRRIF